jgi:Protein of unknown function (DUF1217)
MATVLTTAASFNIINQNLDRSLKTAAAKPEVARETEYYLANIGKVKSVDDFIGNTRLFNYAMKAWGLGDMSYAKAFMRKVLTEGIDSSTAFANTLADKRYYAFAEAFNFQRYNTATTSFDRTQQGTVDKFDRQTLEEDAGADNEGVRLALYFQRAAPNVTSALGLLADKALLQVTQTVLGLSPATGALDIDKQTAMIEAKLDVADLKDPEKLDKLLTRFTNLWDVENQQQVTTNAATILIGGTTSFGISGDLLASLQNLRLGGS